MRIVDPEFTDVRHLGDGVRVAGRLPPELAYFEGHFPGHPLLPGFVQLDWVLGFAQRSLGCRAAPIAFEALKFRSPLVPGEAFTLAIDGGPDRVGFEFRCGERVVSSGRVRFDSGVAPHEPALIERAPADTADTDTLPLLLPHGGRMRVIDRVLAHGDGSTLCEAEIHADTPLCGRAGPSTALAVELLAQTMAAHGGLVGREAGGAQVGFLVGSRRIELRTAGFQQGERLWIRAQHTRGLTGIVAFDCALGSGPPPLDPEDARERALAHGGLLAYIESRAE